MKKTTNGIILSKAQDPTDEKFIARNIIFIATDHKLLVLNVTDPDSSMRIEPMTHQNNVILDRNQKYTILERRDGVTLWKQPKKFIAELKEKHFDKLFYSTEQFPSVYSGIEILEENFAKEYICRKTKAMQCWYGSGCGIELKEVLFAENQTYMIIRHSEQYYYIFDFKLYLECKYMEDFIKSEILIISK